MESLKQQLDDLVTKMCQVQSRIDRKAVELGIFKEFIEIEEMVNCIGELNCIIEKL